MVLVFFHRYMSLELIKDIFNRFPRSTDRHNTRTPLRSVLRQLPPTSSAPPSPTSLVSLENSDPSSPGSFSLSCS